LNYYGDAISEETLTDWVFSPNAAGSFPAEIDAVARQQGFISYPVQTLEDALKEINAGHPVLILQNLGTSWYRQWHFAVIVGYDLSTQTLILRSGDQPRRQTPFRLFDTTWQRSHRWARVVLPPSKLPATAQPLVYLKAASELELTGPTLAALEAYQTALQQWPKQPIARFGLANQLLAHQHLPSAEQQFRQLLTDTPQLSAAWNNYAYSLKALGCYPQARQAALCAILLEPDNTAYNTTHQDMLASTATNIPSTGNCPIQIPTCPTY
jgi:tetratricopeptide (TPR) repeat protein